MDITAQESISKAKHDKSTYGAAANGKSALSYHQAPLSRLPVNGVSALMKLV